MKHLLRILPVVLAAVLQLMPLLRNIVTSPAAGSTMALILRWGIGSAATVGAFDACSGATNYFTSTNIFTGTVGVPFTNNLTLLASGKDGQIVASIISNSVSVSLTSNGQTTNFAMPPGLNFRLIDNTALANGVYDSIFGTPTVAGTNAFTIFMSYAGQTSVSTNITIRILATVSSPPILTNNPVSLTNLTGSNPSFSVTAGGTAPLKYLWFFNTNTAVLNATNTTLTLTNVQLTDAGFYRVIITNSTGSVTSSSALLTVWQPPVITNNLVAGVTNVAGSSTSLSVVAGGFPALAYQWRFATTGIANATNASLSLTNLRASQSGNYTVVLTNSAGALTSSIAVLAVTNPLPRQLTSPTQTGGIFQFTFVPTVGLTNTVQVNNDLTSSAWMTFTNVPPPLTASPVTITDALGSSNRFYRVQLVP